MIFFKLEFRLCNILDLAIWLRSSYENGNLIFFERTSRLPPAQRTTFGLPWKHSTSDDVKKQMKLAEKLFVLAAVSQAER